MPNNRVNFFMYGSSPSRSSSATTGIPSRSSQPGLGVSSSTFHPHTQVSPVGTTSPLSSGEISSRANKENPPSSMPGHFPEPEIVFVSLSTTCSEEHSNDAKELLEQLNSLKIKSANLQEVVADIYHMGAQILLHDEGDEKFDDGGVSIQMFIPFTTDIVRQTVFSVESYIKTLENTGMRQTKSSNLKKFLRKPVLRRLVPNKLTKSNDNAHESFTITLVELHTQMRVIHFIAMPYDKPSTHSQKIDNILAISANMGSVLTIVFDGVPVLGMLKPAVCALSGICTAVQTFRSNKNLAVEILYTVRDDIRWVIRKIQKDYTSRMVYTTEGPWELGKDVNEYFQ
ncbi:hypothetical protein C8R41DRAFT_924581 [Lentinula lateritia]|uniref:Uncharacterized protein n=1 Tax=Lentinula lateritia TaxID=40482 RepID=A0ABQ8V4A3_9AGAR|nr:hypothetical protein C8R41DRAFT_924581 [Lentinula lateritia]